MPESSRIFATKRKLVGDRTRVTNQIIGRLKEFYPQALRLFCKPDSAISIAFLSAFPDPQTLLAASRRRLRAFLKAQHYPYMERVDELYGKIQAPAPQADPVIVQAGGLRLLALLDQLRAVRQHQDRNVALTCFRQPGL